MPYFYHCLYPSNNNNNNETTTTTTTKIMTNNNTAATTTVTKQIEFYDEELSRTLRQIQEILANDASNPRLDQLFTTAAAYIQQMQLLSLQISKKKSKDGKESNQQEQWKEIINFRKTTYHHLQQSVHTVEFD